MLSLLLFYIPTNISYFGLFIYFKNNSEKLNSFMLMIRKETPFNDLNTIQRKNRSKMLLLTVLDLITVMVIGTAMVPMAGTVYGLLTYQTLLSALGNAAGTVLCITEGIYQKKRSLAFFKFIPYRDSIQPARSKFSGVGCVVILLVDYMATYVILHTLASLRCFVQHVRDGKRGVTIEQAGRIIDLMAKTNKILGAPLFIGFSRLMFQLLITLFYSSLLYSAFVGGEFSPALFLQGTIYGLYQWGTVHLQCHKEI